MIFVINVWCWHKWSDFNAVMIRWRLILLIDNIIVIIGWSNIDKENIWFILVFSIRILTKIQYSGDIKIMRNYLNKGIFYCNKKNNEVITIFDLLSKIIYIVKKYENEGILCLGTKAILLKSWILVKSGFTFHQNDKLLKIRKLGLCHILDIRTFCIT